MNEELIAHLEAGATLLTATRRLARAVESEYARLQQQRGARTWATPAIYSYPAWLGRLWGEAEDLGLARQRLLEPLFERTLWEKYLHEDRSVSGLFDKKVAAAQVQDAYAVLRQQGKTLQQLPPYLSFDAAAFKDWARRFERDCAKHNWLPAAELEWRLGELIADGSLRCAGPVVFQGFDQFTPAQLHIQGALDAARIEWRAIDIAASPAAQASVSAAVDSLHELTAAARWARDFCERDPTARVGIVVLDLERRRRLVERVCRDIFAPGPLWQEASLGERVNFSLGRSLVDEPPVREALWLLELCAGEVEWSRVSALMRSPHFFSDGAPTAGQCALREIAFRDYATTTVGLSALADWEGRRNRKGEADVGTAWSKVYQVVKQWPARARVRRWREHFDSVLAAGDWLSQRDVPYAAHIREWWANVADRLSGLDGWIAEINAGEAVARLKQLLSDEIVQEETPFAPVQVLGGLEAGGLRFDAVWVAGARDDILPAPVHPNPFLPAQWQRREGFPRSDPQLERAYAMGRIQGWLAMAPRVVFSYSQKEGDQQFGPSPLLRGVPIVNDLATGGRFADPWCEAQFGAAPLEHYLDEQGPPLPSNIKLSGGTSLIKAQSLCPFQGFAAAQLAAEPLSEPDEGFDAAERGTLIHEAMRVVWTRVKTQSQLNALDDEGLRRIVETAAAHAVDVVAARAKRTLPRRLLHLERLRLTGVVRRWLEFEATRPPFEVEAVEQGRSVRIGPLELNIRVDRIDRLSGGARVIIDYKTGKPEVKNWFGPRPDEPQLPLYAVTDEDRVDGLLFGRIRPGEMGVVGLSAASDCDAGVTSYLGSKFCHGDMTWSDQLNEWRGRLEGLAGELAAGAAQVAPKDGVKTCAQCQRTTLCRVFELTQVADMVEEDGDESDASA